MVDECLCAVYSRLLCVLMGFLCLKEKQFFVCRLIYYGVLILIGGNYFLYSNYASNAAFFKAMSVDK